MEEILVCVAMTVVIYAFMFVAYKKGWYGSIRNRILNISEACRKQWRETMPGRSSKSRSGFLKEVSWTV